MDSSTALALASLIVGAAQTCFLAFLSARYGDTKQRITELQQQAREIASTMPQH